ELTWDGDPFADPPVLVPGTQRTPLKMPTGEERRFLQDGDEVIMRAYCEREGFRRIGVGECRGIIEPARVPCPLPRPDGGGAERREAEGVRRATKLRRRRERDGLLASGDHLPRAPSVGLWPPAPPSGRGSIECGLTRTLPAKGCP